MKVDVKVHQKKKAKIKPLTLRKVIIIIIVIQIRWENVESSKFNLFRECFIPGQTLLIGRHSN